MIKTLEHYEPRVKNKPAGTYSDGRACIAGVLDEGLIETAEDICMTDAGDKVASVNLPFLLARFLHNTIFL
jgi:hypothetical protein